MAVNRDGFTPAVFVGCALLVSPRNIILSYYVFVRSPGAYKLDKASAGTDFVILAVRILVDANNAKDIRVNGHSSTYLNTRFVAHKSGKEIKIRRPTRFKIW
jgi:hypothetical protein